MAKKTVKKIVKKTQSVKKSKAPVLKIKLKVEKPIGIVTHFYNGIKVAIVKFSKPVKSGSEIRFEGATTDFSQKVASMQYDHKDIAVAPKGKQVGLKVSKRVREGDKVYSQ